MISTDTLIEKYVALEVKVHKYVTEVSGKYCCDCDTPCCHSRHCVGVTHHTWLRKVAEYTGATVPAGEAKEGELCFLCETGCFLDAGRPIECTWYICDMLSIKLVNPLERFAYQILCTSLGYVVRKVTKDKDLLDFDDLEKLSVRQREKILERIEKADQCTDIIVDLLRRKDEQDNVLDVAEKMLYVCRTFQYASSVVRFEGEIPSLSKTGREKLI
ncbi:MAG: hypothetical protein PF692_03475 [Kiritimatiellae bacterium]|jgi:hypothetical protein|nr:hypothetical protein [Kiritimatiellia bacterium]